MYELVVMGGSLGGAQAATAVLGELPGSFPLPLALVLHRSPDSDDTLCRTLAATLPLPVIEAEDHDELAAGRLALAPAGYHLLVEPGCLRLSLDPPVGFARPSIDVLFESAADAYAERVVGVLLTGSGSDGVAGLAVIHRRGGLTIVQHPNEAEAGRLPEEAIRAGVVDQVLPLGGIAALLAGLVKHHDPR